MSPRKPAKSNIEEFVAPGVLEHGLVAPGLTENELLTGVASEASFDPSDKIESGFRQGARVFAQNKLAMISVFVLGFLVIACFFGQYVWHTNQTSLLAQIGVPQNAAPSLSHPLGTDINGFDELGRILYGGKYSLTLGFLAGLIESSTPPSRSRASFSSSPSWRYSASRRPFSSSSSAPPVGSSRHVSYVLMPWSSRISSIPKRRYRWAPPNSTSSAATSS